MLCGWYELTSIVSAVSHTWNRHDFAYSSAASTRDDISHSQILTTQVARSNTNQTPKPRATLRANFFFICICNDHSTNAG